MQKPTFNEKLLVGHQSMELKKQILGGYVQENKADLAR